jgi:hypothetical protein
VEVRETSVRLLLLIERPGFFLHCEWDGPPNFGTVTFLSDPFPQQMKEQLDLDGTEVLFLEHNPAVYYVPLSFGAATNNGR